MAKLKKLEEALRDADAKLTEARHARAEAEQAYTGTSINEPEAMRLAHDKAVEAARVEARAETDLATARRELAKAKKVKKPKQPNKVDRKTQELRDEEAEIIAELMAASATS